MKDLIIKGGPIMVVILALSILALTLVIERIYYLSLYESENIEKIKNEIINFLNRHDLNGAKAYIVSKKSSVSSILNYILNHSGEPKDVIVDKINEALIKRASLLEKNLWLINLVMQVAPLLGLLGTVTGMIKVFNVISIEGNADPSLLSGGIAEALLTTAAGLFVVVPLSLIYGYMVNKIDRILGEMESTSLEVLHMIKGD